MLRKTAKKRFLGKVGGAIVPLVGAAALSFVGFGSFVSAFDRSDESDKSDKTTTRGQALGDSFLVAPAAEPNDEVREPNGVRGWNAPVSASGAGATSAPKSGANFADYAVPAATVPAPAQAPASFSTPPAPAQAPAPTRAIAQTSATVRTAPTSALESAFARVEAATVRLVATEGDRTDVATGVVAHYNAEAGEALAVTCGHLFRDVRDENALKIAVDLCDPATGRTTTVPGEKVYCDVETDVAFVALRVPFAVRPVSFLPEGDALRVGEKAFSFARGDAGVAPLRHEVLSLDRHYFRPQAGDERRKPFYYAQVANAPEPGRSGSGLFVERSNRLYWAGVCVAGDAEKNDGFFVPAEVVCQALATSDPLAAALSDQRSGKFDDAPDARLAQNLRDVQNAPTPRAALPSQVAATPVPSAVAPENKIRSTNYEPRVPASVSAAAPSSTRVRSGSEPSDEELFDAALDALRRRGLEGAEIVCVVNWPRDADGGANARRETEVVRLPRLAAANADTAAPNVGNANAEIAPIEAASTFPDDVARR